MQSRSILRATTVALIALLAAPSHGEQTPEAAAADPPRLRCWQEGQLIFEKLDWKALSLRKERVTLHSKGQAGSQLVLLDVGTATCLIEETE